MTLISDLLPAYEDYLLNERQLVMATIRAYLSDLRGLDSYLRKSVEEISRDDLRAYMRHLGAMGRSSATVRRKMFGYGTFFKWLQLERRITDANVSAGIVLPKKKRKQPAVMSEDQVRLFVRTPAAGAREALAWRLLAWLGLRTSEVLKLKCRDVQIDQRTLILRSTKNGDDARLPIPRALVKPLARAISGRDGDEWLCGGTQGGYWGRERFGIAFKQQLQRAGLDGLGFTPRALRHSCWSHKEQRGVPIRTIQGLSRHKRIESLQQYLHVSSTALADAVEVSPLAEVK